MSFPASDPHHTTGRFGPEGGHCHTYPHGKSW